MEMVEFVIGVVRVQAVGCWWFFIAFCVLVCALKYRLYLTLIMVV